MPLSMTSKTTSSLEVSYYRRVFSVNVSTSLICIGDLGILAKRGRAELCPISPRSSQDEVRWAEVTLRRCHLEAVKAVSKVEISRIKVSYNEDLSV